MQAWSANPLEHFELAVSAALAKRAADEAAALERAVFLREKAQALSEPVVSTPISAATKIAGTSGVEFWHAEIQNFKALVDAVASGVVPIEALEPNQAWLNKQAAALKSNFNFAGVNAVSTQSISQRAA